MDKRRNFATVAVFAGMTLLTGVSSGAPDADTYKVDGVHSTAIFRVKHMDASYAYGRFDEVTGTFTIDEKAPERCAFNVQVAAGSVDTNNPKRDQHLKGPDFLNAKQFPTIAFKSKTVKKAGKDTYEVVGDLTLHGVTKPVTVTIETVGPIKKPLPMGGGYAAGFEAHLTLKRSDFGMVGMVGPVGDEVRAIISVEGARP